MKKNKLMMAVVSASLVGVVAVGGTLAYLSDKSNNVTNTFTLGTGYATNALTLDETKVTPGAELPTAPAPGEENRVGTDQSYPDLLPGAEFAKDPTFHLEANSPKSYIIAKVTNAQAAEDANYIFKDAAKNVGFDSNWKKVANSDDKIIGKDGVADDGSLDGYYLFVDDNKAGKIVEGGQSTEAIFTYVQLDPSVNNTNLSGSDNKTTTVIGVAVQADNNTEGNAVAEAVQLLK